MFSAHVRSEKRRAVLGELVGELRVRSLLYENLAAVWSFRHRYVLDQVLLPHAGIAQKDRVLERLSVPVLNPVVMTVRFEKRGIEPSIELGLPRFARVAGLLDEIHVELR